MRTEVWDTDTFNIDDIIAIFSRTDSEVARVLAVGAVVVEFATPSALVPSVASSVNIGEHVLVAAAPAGFSAEFEMEANNTVVRLDELSFTPVATPPEVALVEFAAVSVNASNSVPITAQGQISPGTTLVPDDPENWELDRRQSLIEHELEHTFQAAQLGPLLFGLFPTFIFRIVTDLTARTEFELPKFALVESDFSGMVSVGQRPPAKAVWE